jgi:hypothetical protein
VQQILRCALSVVRQVTSGVTALQLTASCHHNYHCSLALIEDTKVFSYKYAQQQLLHISPALSSTAKSEWLCFYGFSGSVSYTSLRQWGEGQL